MHALLLIALLAALAAGEPSLVVALKPDKNPDAMAAERRDLAQALTAALGRRVEVIVPTAAAVIATGLANGTVDAAHLAATDLARAADAGPAAARAVLAVSIHGRTVYESLWLCRIDRPYRDIEDLRGRPVAFASRTSTSGCIVPLHDLLQRGLLAPGGRPEDFFGAGNVFYGSGYVSAVERVLAGSAEAAAVSDYVYEGERHLTAAQKAQLRVLQRQGPVPTHVIVLRRALPEAEAQALTAAFAGLEPALRDRIFGGPLVAVDEDAHLAPIRAALTAVRTLRW